LARPRRPLAAPAAVLAASLAVLSVAGQVYPRHILLASAAATLLAAAGLGAAAARLPRAATVALAAAALAVPALRGVAVARGYARPTELDGAGRWIEARPGRQRVATSLPRLRLHGPIELRAGLPLWEWPPAALAHYDLLVAPRAIADRLAAVEILQEFAAPGNPGGAILLLRALPHADAPWPRPSAVRASGPGAERAWDGDEGTAWTAPAGPGWLEAEWDPPRPLHAIEVVVPGGEGYWPQRLRLRARGPDGAWQPVEGAPIRPARAALQQPPHGQLFVLDPPVTAGALRIERREGRQWGLAEVRVYERAGR
ncbi:MAG TPA: hypothetical protein VFO85_12175, partial [Vicinamibacteria bacterium]|nr:hypothetical protein [Vicinamibacteria bacterium]